MDQSYVYGDAAHSVYGHTLLLKSARMYVALCVSADSNNFTACKLACTLGGVI